MSRKNDDSLPRAEDSGLKAYREPGEPFDGRCWVISRDPFWRDMTEELTYQHAVEANPKRPNEGPGSYIVRIAEIVAGKKLGAVKSMPEAPDLEERRDELWQQRKGDAA